MALLFPEITSAHYLHSLFVCDNFLICNKKLKNGNAAVHKASESAIDEILKSQKSGDNAQGTQPGFLQSCNH
jgi:hypothetical protein